MRIEDQHCAGLILAGGRSTRMDGRDKALIELDGRPLIAHALEAFRPQVGALAINAGPGTEAFAGYGLPVIRDETPDFGGPLSGVLVGLGWARQVGATHLATVAVDTPFFPDALVMMLADACRGPEDIAVAASQGGAHPVFALWPVALEADLRGYLAGGGHRKVRRFQDRHPVREVHFPPLRHGAGLIDPFFNINQPADMAAAADFLRNRGED